MSGRTDGGPADRQPIRSIPAESHGQGQQLQEMQGAAPMAAGGAGLTPQAAPGQPMQQAPAVGGVFGPTERPDEPVTAGVNMGPGAGDPSALLPPVTYMAAEALYHRFGTPGIARLLNYLDQER